MRLRRSVFTSIFAAAGICAALFLSGISAWAGDRHMAFDGIDGDVTTNEYRSFINELKDLPPPPTNEIDNLMVDESDGARLHGMQTFYEFTHDRRDSDMAIVWSDAFLHARNDPTNGRVIWTGKRELCWPNEATNDQAHALYSGAENGDVIEHTVNNSTNTTGTLTVDSYYDPQIKYQEVAVGVNGLRTWKVHGPDISGRYGGMQGVGGVEATAQEADGTVVPVINDYFGNVLASVTLTNLKFGKWCRRDC